MTDLTEQWKKGELINGKKYYITFFDSEPFEATFRSYEAMFPYWKFEANDRQYCDENGYDCVKVLAPVPSYDELQNMNKAVNECMAANIKLVEQNKRLKHDVGNLGYKIKNQRHEIERQIAQNAQLKELLKECREEIASVEWDSVANDRNQMKLLTKIDEALK